MSANNDSYVVTLPSVIVGLAVFSAGAYVQWHSLETWFMTLPFTWYFASLGWAYFWLVSASACTGFLLGAYAFSAVVRQDIRWFFQGFWYALVFYAFGSVVLAMIAVNL